MVITIALALFCLFGVMMAADVWWKGRDIRFLGLALGCLAGAALFSWLTSLLHSARTPASPKPAYCQCCREFRPTIKVSLNRHIGAIVLMFHKSLSGYLCKDCIRSTFWSFMPITVLFGWWGIISVFVTPIVIINNLIVFVRSFFMPERNAARETSGL